MRYSELIEKGINDNKLSLSQVCMKLAKSDIWLDRATLSKLKNGKLPPAKDKVNIALASALGIDASSFRIAAAKELIDPELFELIKTADSR